jgi:hypothetical protein
MARRSRALWRRFTTLPYVCPSRDWRLLFSDAIDEVERARLAGDHTRLRETPTAEQAVYVGAHYRRFHLRRRRSYPPSCAISLVVLRVSAGSLTWRAGGRPISRAG